MLIGAQYQRQMKPKSSKCTLMNIVLDEVNRTDVKYEVNIPNDTLLIYYQSEIQVVCLAGMKLERIIDYIPCSITSAGVHSTGVYLTSNRRRASEIFIHDRETICHPINIAVESCILAHLACEYDDEPYIVVLCADLTLKIYSARSGERIVDKKIAILADLSPISVSLSILEENKWICICVDGKTLVFVDMRDWHASYPISEHFDGIEMVLELNSRGPY